MAAAFSAGMQWLLGTACGLLVANLYYAQPLTGLIGPSLGMSPESIGLLVTLPLAGYGTGLLMVVPLGDLIENRRLVLALVAAEAVSLAFITQLENATAFLRELGNPYDKVGADRDNRVSIDWGVYGVPETFVVDRNGVITFKHVGPMTPETLTRDMIPAIQKAEART